MTVDSPTPNSHAVGVTIVASPPEAMPKAALVPQAASGGFDPGAHTVAEVQAYLEANPEAADEIYAAEQAGKARTTLLDWLAAQGG